VVRVLIHITGQGRPRPEKKPAMADEAMTGKAARQRIWKYSIS